MKMKNMERALGRTQGLRISREVFTVIRQLTVFDPDDAVCRLQDAFIVGSDDDAETLFFDGLPQQAGDHVAVFRIKIRCGFIGQNDPGAVYKGAGKGDALFFSGRKILGEVIETMAQAYILEDFNGSGMHVSRAPWEKIPHQGDIFPRGQCRQEIEALEDKSDGFSPKPCEFL